MPIRYLNLVIIILLISLSNLFAEGTKEIMQNASYNGRIIMDPEFGAFGMYGSGHNDRLHIRINQPGERIFYGFGASVGTAGEGQYIANDVIYRIMDPDGVMVKQSTLQPHSGAGYINTYQEAIKGPNTFDPAGYEPLTFTCNKIGDYYIEFNFPDAANNERREFIYFDFTVVKPDNQPVKGRVWSKAWMFTVSEKGGYPYSNPFYGKLFILSDDGIVTSVDFNGMKPFVFTMFANGTGIKNTGNPIEDRMSVPDRLNYPQYKVFLNDPDPDCYPSGSFGEFSAPSSVSLDGNSYCINVTTTKPGSVQVLIELNGVEGYQVNSSDVLLVKNVDAGLNCISWDGIDGKGNVFDKCNGSAKFYITYAGGLTHMPIFDVETNENGFIVELVRPVTSNSHLALYWDDRNIDGYTLPPSGGCDGLTGCHKFPYFYGDESTINTWWYSTSSITNSVEISSSVISVQGLDVKNQTCSNKDDGFIEILGTSGAPPFQYALNSGNYQNSPVFKDLTADNYVVTIKDQNSCTKTYQVNIDLNTAILADFEVYHPGPYNEIEFDFIGEGASLFEWDFGDGELSDEQNPFHQYAYDSVFYVKLVAESGAPDFCVDSITKPLEIYQPLLIVVPTAFTPNGDRLNDEFKISSLGAYSYDLYIYSRTGTQIYSSSNIEESWDGTSRYGNCTEGVYAYVIRAKDWKGVIHEKKGTVMLHR